VLTPRQQAVLGSPGGDPLGPLWEAAVLLSLTGYGLGCLGALHRYRLWLVEHRADDDVWAGHWIRAVLLGLLAGLAGQAAYWGYAFLSARPDVFDLYPFHLGLAGVGVYLGMEGRRFGDRPFPHEGGAPPPAPEPAPAGEALRDWRATGEAWRERLHAAEWWREPGLTLAELARRLGTNTNHLSRALNEGLGQNFSAVVNGMRAEEVARVLGGPEGDRDLLELAFDSGFSSKASFNRAFRAVHGCSPSEFRARGRLRS
jgi:AraC-like DNA-binding protein